MTETVGKWAENDLKTSAEDYKTRYKLMKSTIKQLILENGALCYEIESVENKLMSAKIERKVLLKRLLQFEKPESKSVKSGQKRNNHNSVSKDAAFLTSSNLEEYGTKKSKRIKVE